MGRRAQAETSGRDVGQGLLGPDDLARPACSGCPSARRAGRRGTGRGRPRPCMAAWRRCGEVLLASETSQIRRAVAEQPDPDGAGAVADGVGDQLAEDQLGGERQLVQAPVGQLPGDRGAHLGDGRRVGRARSHSAIRSAASARVRATSRAMSSLGRAGQQGVEDGLGRSPRATGRRAASARAQQLEARVDVPVAVLDEPVGVEDQPAALGQLAARPSRRAGRRGRAADRRARRGTRRVPSGRTRAGGGMAGAGHRCSCRDDRVVDGVQAGGAGDRRRRRPSAASSWSIRPTSSSRWASSSSGGRSRAEKLCTAVRSRPMVAAACSPWPDDVARRPGRPGRRTAG